MPRKVIEQSLATRTSRAKLAGRGKPYYRLIEPALHLGYRRPAAEGRVGTWVARRYLGDERYEMEVLGSADDSPRLPADGENVLTFDQAISAARRWATAKVEDGKARAAAEGAPTVRSAVLPYIEQRKARSLSAGQDAEYRLQRHVLEALIAELPIPDLTERTLSDWRKSLRRGGRGAMEGGAPLAPATVARLLNDLRAALSAAVRKARLSGELLTVIKEALKAPEAATRARPKQILSDGDVRRVCDAARSHDEDFGDLIMTLAATGARFNQIAQLTVADLQAEQRRLMVPTSAKGRGKKQVTHIAIPVADDVIARLKQITADRHGHEPLLTRWHHRQAEGARESGRLQAWVRDRREAWRSSDQLTRPWDAVLAAASLPRDLVPYCLRHSSIVRGLRAGLPVRLVASAHDTSVAMIERHYGAFIVDASEDLLRRAVVALGADSTDGRSAKKHQDGAA